MARLRRTTTHAGQGRQLRAYLVVCVVWYGGKALLIVVFATCWGAYFTLMLPFWLLGWAEWRYLRE